MSIRHIQPQLVWGCVTQIIRDKQTKGRRELSLCRRTDSSPTESRWRCHHMAFAHLHVHSVYSLLDGAGKINEIISAAKELGQDSIALTDHGNMYGVIEFYEAALKEGIHPIIGCEMYVSPRKHTDRDPSADRESRHLVLLCENNVGYQNLIKLNTLAFTEGFYGKPRVDLDQLREHHEGLIALSACLSGEIPRALLQNDYPKAKKAALTYQDIFGKDNFFIELQDHGLTEEKRIAQMLISLAKECQIPLAVTNDCHYIRHEDSHIQDVLVCIQTQRTLSDNNPMRFETDEFYLKSEEEMRALFPQCPEAADNTAKIAERCQVTFEFGKLKLPHFDVPDNRDHTEYFRELCYQGLYRRYGEHPDKTLYERLEYEIKTISSMGFVDYFLIVSDYVSYAKSHDIPVGPGRGSGAGSLAAYCIGITGIDPIRYDLIFERFLNPERVSMPDFDIDFCKERRQEVIDYVTRKYGKDHVVQIVAFDTMAAKAAVRDAGRVMGLPVSVCDKIAKLIPRELNITIEKALSISHELKKVYDEDSQIHELIDTASKIEGMPRHLTLHAAGVVITDRPASDYIPLVKNNDILASQFTMTTLDKLGLLKMDFLALRNLTVMHDAEMMIRRSEPDFRLDNIPENDKQVFALFSSGDTEGVFQFESAGMKNILTQLKPQCLEDIIAVISLYRPGPMESIPRYIENRHHPEKITYKHPLLEPILKVTYGVIIYQEQVMQIFRTLAGYSLGRADQVRRAMSKKKKHVMEEERRVFIYGLTDENGNVLVDGCIRRGVSEDTAKSLFAEMESFASYAFNKSHAACYALVAYQTAYLKAHYFSQYFSALLTSVLDNAGKVEVYIDECSQKGICVLPPDVNESELGFTIQEDKIRFGLMAVNSRVYGFELNKRSLESLIRCGALDHLGANRRQMILALDTTLEWIAEKKNNSIEGQMDLFGMTSTKPDEPPLPNALEYPDAELLEMEKNSTGLYFSGHPLSEYDEVIRQVHSDRLNAIIENDGQQYHDGKKVDVFAIIGKIKVKTTKKGQQMAFVDIEDKYAGLEMIVFPNTLQEFGNLLRETAILRISGTVSLRDEELPKIICHSLQTAPKQVSAASLENDTHSLSHHYPERAAASPINPYKKTKPGLYLRVPNQESEAYRRAIQITDIFDGATPLYIYFTDTKLLWATPPQMHVSPNSVMLNELKRRIGEENVKLV